MLVSGKSEAHHVRLDEKGLCAGALYLFGDAIRGVVRRVFLLRLYFKIIGVIVEFVFIDMVDIFTRFQGPPQLVLHDDPVERVEVIGIAFRVWWSGSRCSRRLYRCLGSHTSR